MFLVNDNRHAIKPNLNYKITKDMKMDFRCMQTDHGASQNELGKQKYINWSLVQKNEVANTKAENSLAQANY